MRYLVFVFCKCYLTNHGAKDGVQMATPIGITLQRSILYTLASFGTHYFPTLPNLCICASFQIQTLSTYVEGANTTNFGWWNLSIIFTHDNMLGQATWIQKEFIEYLCKWVVINYQKGEIESPSLILDNWWNLSTNLCHQVWIWARLVHASNGARWWWSRWWCWPKEMIKCSNLEKKKNKNKNQVLIKTKVSNRFLFWHTRHHIGCECV